MNSENSDGFFQIYVKLLTGDTIEINVRKNYTIQKLKEIIKNKTNISKDILYLTFKKPLLDEKKTLENYGIAKCAVIRCFPNVMGGGWDFRLNNTRIIEFDNNAPFYRKVGKGLSIQAICGNDCEAKDQIVYCLLGCVRDYDILQHLSEIKCPACKKEVYPKNFGFLRCNYEIYYEKWENNKKETGTVSGYAEDEFKVFDEYSSGNANFSKLVFNVS